MKQTAVALLAVLVLIVMVLALLVGAPVSAAQVDTPTPTLVRTWDVHCYILIEVDPAIPQPALVQAWRAIRAMGRQLGDPNLITHYRLRLDNRAAIVESTFNPAELSRAAVINRLAYETGYTPTQVDNALSFTLFDCWQGYEVSRAATRQYLREHAAEWEPEL